MKKIFKQTVFVFTVLSFSILFFPQISNPIHAIQCGDDLPKEEDRLEEYIENCEDQIGELRARQETLAETISYLDNQVYLTQAEIYQTESQLEKLNLEIQELSEKIQSIDYSLTDLTKLFIQRVRKSYKDQQSSSLLPISILESQNLPDFVRNLKYIKKVRDHDHKVMVKLEQSRLEYDDRKDAKEQKQAKVKSLQSQLESQRNTLAQQKATKENLLEKTKNDEQRYQKLLSQANTRLQRFKTYTESRGGATLLSNQTKCNEGWSGCYYSQRDSQWGNNPLGETSYLMKDSGCFVTSVAMMASYYGKSVKPNDIAVLPTVFTTAGYLNWSFSVNGINVSIQSPNVSTLDSRLESGTPVIAELYGGDHFIVILRKDGDTYIMNDPFLENGYNKPLSASDITASDITSLRVVSFD